MPRGKPNRHSTRKEAAATLRAILTAVEEGELSANTAQERRLLRRIEGAIIALEQPAKWKV